MATMKYFTLWALCCLSLSVDLVNADKEQNQRDYEELRNSTIMSFFKNILSYAFLIVPGALIVRYYQQHPEKIAGPSIVNGILRNFVHGVEQPSASSSSSNDPLLNSDLEKGQSTKPSTSSPAKGDSDSADNSDDESFMKKAASLVFCVLGLQGSYLTWGVLQEQMMTQSYGLDEQGEEVFFGNSQYLVFLNRFLALIFAVLIINFTRQPNHGTPLHKFSYPSMSNILSSWCQYEALKYVSFPTQVLAKASKVIPVMLMGKLVSGKTYPAYEYGCALMISVGVSLFLFGRAGDKAVDENGDEEPTSYLGGLILVGYMVFDSFTSNYQSHLFKTYKMSSYQMMFGVNLFSAIFCLWTLIQKGEFYECLIFTSMHPLFFWHSTLLSITSATGQLFIFWTLSKYGPLVFAIIMTTRQAISVFLSALIFGHEFSEKAWFGVMIVFAAMFAKIYFNTTSKNKGKGRG